MFNGFSEKTVGFFWGIRLHNYKSWFEEHRNDYVENVQKPLQDFASEIEERFIKKYPEELFTIKIARIYRDARRLFGRGPYKDNLWISIHRETEEHTDRPGYWFGIGAETLSYGMGYFMPKAETMAKHRARIDSQPQKLTALAEELASQDTFTLYGEPYKKPKGHPGGILEDWYNLRNIGFEHEEPVGPQIEDPALVDRVIEGFEFLLPFYDYFSGLVSDPVPGTDKDPK